MQQPNTPLREGSLALTLTPMQQSQYVAHLLVYLLSQAADLTRPRHKATCALVQEVTYRLMCECRQICRERTIALSAEEAQAVRDAFVTLFHRYTQWDTPEASSLARKDLLACRVLLEQAESQTTMPGESREHDEP